MIQYTILYVKIPRPTPRHAVLEILPRFSPGGRPSSFWFFGGASPSAMRRQDAAGPSRRYWLGVGRPFQEMQLPVSAVWFFLFLAGFLHSGILLRSGGRLRWIVVSWIRKSYHILFAFFYSVHRSLGIAVIALSLLFAVR